MTNLPDIPPGHSKILIDSYRHWTGRELLESTREDTSIDEQLFLAPFILLSHGIENDPVLNYGNMSALTLWKMEYHEFTQMPSRLTAEPQNREERSRLLAEVSEKGYSDSYQGVRINQKGERFYIENATVWNLIDSGGNPKGQAATFNRFKMID